MNSLMAVGTVLSVSDKRTNTSGQAKCEFTLNVVTKELPLRFHCVTFGSLAESLFDLTAGEWLLVTGRLEGSIFNGKAGFSFLLRDAQRFAAPETEESSS